MTNGTGLAPNLKRRIFSPATLISFIIAVLLIVFLLRGFDVDLEATWRQVRSADVGFYLIGFFIYYLSFPVRGYRWKLLVRNAHAEGTPRPLAGILGWSEYIFLGWYVNTLSWFHMGDAYRGYLVTRRSQVNFSKVIGTILAERMLDTVVVAVLFGIAAFALWSSWTSATAYLVILSGGLVVFSAVALAGMAILGKMLRERLPHTLKGVYSNFEAGTLKSFRNLPWLMAVSVFAWLLEAARLYFMARSLGVELSPWLVLFTALAGSLLTTLPLTPGGVGIVETGMAGLFMLAMSQTDAVALTILDRSVSYLTILVFGTVLFLFRQFGRKDGPRRPPEPSAQRAAETADTDT